MGLAEGLQSTVWRLESIYCPRFAARLLCLYDLPNGIPQLELSLLGLLDRDGIYASWQR